MMREAGPQERIVNEAKDLNLMNFKFKDNEKPLSIVMYMAECLRVSICWSLLMLLYTLALKYSKTVKQCFKSNLAKFLDFFEVIKLEKFHLGIDIEYYNCRAVMTKWDDLLVCRHPHP